MKRPLRKVRKGIQTEKEKFYCLCLFWGHKLKKKKLKMLTFFPNFLNLTCKTHEKQPVCTIFNK